MVDVKPHQTDGVVAAPGMAGDKRRQERRDIQIPTMGGGLGDVCDRRFVLRAAVGLGVAGGLGALSGCGDPSDPVDVGEGLGFDTSNRTLISQRWNAAFPPRLGSFNRRTPQIIELPDQAAAVHYISPNTGPVRATIEIDSLDSGGVRGRVDDWIASMRGLLGGSVSDAFRFEQRVTGGPAGDIDGYGAFLTGRIGNRGATVRETFVGFPRGRAVVTFRISHPEPDPYAEASRGAVVAAFDFSRVRA